MRVHLLSPDSRLELRRASGEVMCKTPCDAWLAITEADAFVLAGPGIVASEPFHFRLREQAILRVEPSSLPVRTFGKGVLATGAAISLLSAVASYAYLGHCFAGALSEDDCARTPSQVLLATALGGAVLAAVGGLIMVANPPTKFTAVQ